MVVFSGNSIKTGLDKDKSLASFVQNMSDGQLFLASDTAQLWEWDKSLCSEVKPDASCWKYVSSLEPQTFGVKLSEKLLAKRIKIFFLDILASPVTAYECSSDGKLVSLEPRVQEGLTKNIRTKDIFITASQAKNLVKLGFLKKVSGLRHQLTLIR